MDIAYHWHGLETSDALKDYAAKKIEKLSNHFNSLMSAVVRFRTEKLDQVAEFTLHGDGVQFIATDKAHDLYAAIDMVEAKLERQIRKHKEKHLGKKHRSLPQQHHYY